MFDKDVWLIKPSLNIKTKKEQNSTLLWKRDSYQVILLINQYDEQPSSVSNWACPDIQTWCLEFPCVGMQTAF